MADTTPRRGRGGTLETDSDDGTGTTETTPEEVRFRSDGEECAATLYRPRDTGGIEAACVVMGNGFSLTRRDGVPRFAERFAGGHAVHAAARDDRLSAAVSMFPPARRLVAAREYDLRSNVRYTVATVRAAMGRRPIRMPVTGGGTLLPGGESRELELGAPRGELRRYSVGHFDGFLEAFEDVVGDQVAFLDRHLEPSPSA